MVWQQAFAHAGTSPQPAHPSESTEGEKQKMLGLDRDAAADKKEPSAWCSETEPARREAATGMDSITLQALLLKYSAGKP